MRGSLRFASARSLGVVSCACVATLVSAAMSGQVSSGAESPGHAPAPAPSSVPASSPLSRANGSARAPREYLALCAQGHAKFAHRDVAGAIERYQAAIARFPDESLAYAFLGEAELVAGNVADARASLARGAQHGEKDPEATARALFLLAVLEEHEQKWEAAHAAWQAYLDGVTRFPVANGASASAEARLHVLEVKTKLDAESEDVRRRIAATQDGGVFSDPSKSAPEKAH
jgi:TolA-binding protein